MVTPEPPLTRIGIVIDKTFKDKRAIVKKLEKVRIEILEKRPLNTVITVYRVDETGTGNSDVIGRTAMDFDNGEADYNASLEALDYGFLSIKKEILNDTQKYHNTLLISPIKIALTENEEIYIISDFLIVDKLRNMESGQFGPYINLAKFVSKKKVIQHYLHVPRMDDQTKDRLQRFWEVAFFGENGS